MNGDRSGSHKSVVKTCEFTLFLLLVSMIRLLIADDHQVLLDGFASIFDSVDDIEVIATANNGQHVMDQLEQVEVDIILLDINMPVLNGVEVCKKVSQKYPHIKVIALSMYDQGSYVRRMLQYGAKGYLLKNDSADEMIRAIRQVQQGEFYISGQLKEKMASIDFIIGRQKRSNHQDISDRELEVLDLLSNGLTDQEIGEKLFISHHTANSHRKSLIQKLNAKNTVELVRIALDKGLI